MQLTVKGKNVEVTDALRQYAEKRLAKVLKFSDSILSADITFSTERNWHIVEVMIHTSGYVMRAEGRTGDMYASIDNVESKLEKQIKRQKEKQIRKPRAAGTAGEFEIAKPETPPVVMDEREEFTEESLNEEIQVIRRFNPKPMDVKEAIMEMESLGHGFFVFVNSENSRVNVVYKRPKGYGMVDPVIG
ncbi:MAG: ribosome-associated translation inhibitor RaiA [Candidatus Eremiobacteraeota bacterium]|nr:ribosome-associated translation inhibitor RaiA [Candidatus Eremiobacteraeota bacterium]